MRTPREQFHCNQPMESDRTLRNTSPWLGSLCFIDLPKPALQALGITSTKYYRSAKHIPVTTMRSRADETELQNGAFILTLLLEHLTGGHAPHDGPLGFWYGWRLSAFCKRGNEWRLVEPPHAVSWRPFPKEWFSRMMDPQLGQKGMEGGGKLTSNSSLFQGRGHWVRRPKKVIPISRCWSKSMHVEAAWMNQEISKP